MEASNPLHVLSVTSPAFILIGLGYLSVKSGWLTRQGVQGLGWFITRIGLPAAIFHALSSRGFEDILHFDYLVIYAAGSMIAFFAVSIFAKLYWQRSLTEIAFFGMGASMSNSLLIGYPIIVQLFGTAALVPFALTLIVENLLILPLSLALADTGKQAGGNFFSSLLRALRGLLKNPIIIAIALGVLSAAFSITLPTVVESVISSLALTVSGLAQFTIGAILTGVTIKVMSRDMGLVIVGKLLIHPAAIALMILLLPPLDPVFVSVAIILACMPMFSIYAVLGVDYKLGEFCSAALLPTTIISFITINIAIWLLAITYKFG